MTSPLTDSARTGAGLEQAQDLMREGLLQEAVVVYKRFLLKKKGSIDAMVGLAQCHLALGDQKKALEVLDEARRIDPVHPELVATWAQALFNDRKYEDAVEILEAVSEGENATARVLMLLGEAQEKLDRLAQAMRAFETALDIDPSHKPATEAIKRVFERGLKLGVFGEDSARLREIGFRHLRGDRQTLAISLFQHAAELNDHDTQMLLTMGHHLGERELHTQAIQGYRKVLDRKPDNADATAGLAIIYAQRGELDLAVDAINRAIFYAPDRNDLHMYRGDIMLRLGALEEAQRSYREALRLRPNDAEALFALANIHARQGEEMQALDMYTQAIRIKPSFSVSYLNLFHIHQRRKAFGEAARYLRLYRNLNPDDAQGAIRSLSLLDSLGRHRQLLVAADNEIARFGKLPDLLLNKSVGYLGVGETARAKELLEEILEDHPRYAGALNNLGVIAEREDKIDKARLYFEHATRIDPSMAEAHYNLGGLLLAEEKFDEAAGYYQRAIELDPYMAQAYHNLGICHRQVGRHEEAKETFTRGLALAERLADSQLALGQSQLTTGSVSDALETFQELIEENPDYEQTMELLLSLWSGYRARGDAEGTLRTAEAALFFDKDSIGANLAMGVTMHEGDKPDNARRLYEKVLELDPLNPHAKMNLAIYQLDQENNPAKALRLARSAVNVDPGDDSLQFNLGLMLTHAREFEAAIDCFRNAVALNPRHQGALLAWGEIIADKDPETARNCFEQVVLNEPKHRTGWVNLGVVQLRLERYEEAFEAIDRALALDDQDHHALYLKGIALDALRDPEGALASYLAAKELRVTPEILFNLGELRDRLGDLSRAKFHYLECTRKFPGFYPAKVHLARILREEGEFQESLDLLKDALSQASDDPVILFNIGIALAESGAAARAEDLIQQLLEQDPSRADHHLLATVVRLALGRLDEAEASCFQASRIDPDSVLPRVYLGWVQSRQKRFDEAIETLQGVLAKDDSLTIACMILGDVHRQLDDFEAQEACLLKARRLDPGNPILDLHLAWAHLEAGNPGRALALFRDHRGPISHRPIVLRGMGLAQYALRRFGESEECFEKALAPGEQNPHLVYNRALCAYRDGSPDRALRLLRQIPDDAFPRRWLLEAQCHRDLDDAGEMPCYEKALELDPDSAMARLDLAACHYERQSLETAAALLDHPSIEDRVETHWLRGLILEAGGALDEALECYECVGHAPGGLPDALLAAGLIHRARGSFEAETRCYRDGIRRGGDPDLARSLLGQAHILKGQFRRAIRYLLKVGGEGRGPALALAGSARVGLRLFEEAVPLLEEAASILGEHPDLAYNRSLAAVGRGAEDEVRDYVHGLNGSGSPGSYLMESLLETGARRLRLLDEALERFQDHAGLLVARGNLAALEDHREDAAGFYARALTLASAEPPPFLVVNLGHLLLDRTEPLLALRALAEMAGTSHSRFVLALRGRPNFDNRNLLLEDQDSFGPRFDPEWLDPPAVLPGSGP